MTEIRTQPVTATRVDDIDDTSNTPGAFEYFTAALSDAVAGMIFNCPCGCGKQRSLSFEAAESPRWQWDGNHDAPTLSPSVHWVGHWHGWLRNGVWESC